MASTSTQFLLNLHSSQTPDAGPQGSNPPARPTLSSFPPPCHDHMFTQQILTHCLQSARHRIVHRPGFTELKSRSRMKPRDSKAELVPLTQKFLGPDPKIPHVLSSAFLFPQNYTGFRLSTAKFLSPVFSSPSWPFLAYQTNCYFYWILMVSRQYLLNGFTHAMCY